MIEENNREYHYEHKSHWLRTLGVILATLIGAFLAFYFVADMTFNRMTDPSYQMRKMEKMMRHEQKRIERMEQRFGDNPFEPKMAPMLVNLVKDLGGSEKNIDVKLVDNVVTVSGEVEKKEHHREDIMNFSQAYYLDEKVEGDKMTKERKGNKFIITIPFEE